MIYALTFTPARKRHDQTKGSPMTITHPFLPDDPGVGKMEDGLASVGWLILGIGVALGSLATVTIFIVRGMI